MRFRRSGACCCLLAQCVFGFVAPPRPWVGRPLPAVASEYAEVCPAVAAVAPQRNPAHARGQASSDADSRAETQAALDRALERGHCGAAVQALQLLAHRGVVPPTECARVIQRCMTLGQWRTGLRAYGLEFASAKRSGSSPSFGSVRAALRGLQRAREGTAAGNLLESVAACQYPQQRPWRMTQELVSYALNACASSRNAEGAERILTRVTKLLPPDEFAAGAVVYSVLAKAHGRCADGASVSSVLSRAYDNDITPDTIFCNSVIDAYVRSGDVERAHAVACAMFRVRALGSATADGTNERAVDTQLLLSSESLALADERALGGATTAGEGADDLSSSQLDELLARAGAAKVAPDIRTYNTLLKALARQCSDTPSRNGAHRSALERVFALRAEMSSLRVVADHVTEATTIDACVRAGDLARARATLRNATSGSRQTALSAVGVEGYTALLNGLASQGELRSAIDLFREMLRDGVEPNEITCTALIAGFATHGRAQDALRLFRSMESIESVHFTPSVTAYNALITALCRPRPLASAGPAERAPTSGDQGSLDARDETDASRQQQRIAAQRDHSERVRDAIALIGEMKRRGIAPNVYTINGLLVGLTSAEPPRLREAAAMFDEMRARPRAGHQGPSRSALGWGLRPDRFTYTIMISSWGRAGDFARAHSAFNALLADTACGGADTPAVNAYVDACVRCGEMARAQQILAETTSGRSAARAAAGRARALPAPNARTYTILIVGLLRAHANSAASHMRVLKLWDNMMRPHGGTDLRQAVVPDRLLVRWILSAFCSRPSRLSSTPELVDSPSEIIPGVDSETQGALMLDQSLLGAERVLHDLARLGWDRNELVAWQEVVQASQSGLYERWIFSDAFGRFAEAEREVQQRKSSASARIFERHKWNELESGFRWW